MHYIFLKTFIVRTWRTFCLGSSVSVDAHETPSGINVYVTTCLIFFSFAKDKLKYWKSKLVIT